MDNFKQNINSFIQAFNNNEGLNSINLLQDSFNSNPKLTLERLHFSQLLFSSLFLELAISKVNLPKEYSLLFKMLLLNITTIKAEENFITNLSKEQLIKGVAVIIEKNNAEYKFNQAWNNKHTNSNDEYLETERQNMYSTYSGIYFQELLKIYYLTASDVNQHNLIWNENSIKKLKEFIKLISIKINLNDEIEKHIFFNWTFEFINGSTLKSIPPINQRESKLEYDYINSLKSKKLTKSTNEVAHVNFYKTYFETINSKPKQEEFKYFPNRKDEFEMQAYDNAILINNLADITVEKELAFVNERYFPIDNDSNNIILKEGSKLLLKDVFRITAFLCEMSKAVIKDIDDQYNHAVNRFGNETSENFKKLERLLKINAGNPQKQKEILDSNYNEEILKEQQQIISKAKDNIENQFCLIKIPLELLIKSLQWTNQFDREFILNVIDIFTYNPNENVQVGYNPFFRIGDNVYWMPNMVAYHLFSEKLFDNLLSKKLINFDRPQTNFYESNLKIVFRKFGYKVIENDSKKIIKKENGRPIGDFDLLAYKEGKLIHLQLKLTHIRNSFYERYKWIEKLNEASNQLKTGNTFIEENVDYIKLILGLNEDEKIEKIHSLIISNSFLFDHDNIGGFLKITYQEVLAALNIIYQLNSNQSTTTRIDLFTFLSENLLFKELDSLPIKYHEQIINIGHLKLLVPNIVQQNIYSSIN
jgi:hypothetical protein